MVNILRFCLSSIIWSLVLAARAVAHEPDMIDVHAAPAHIEDPFAFVLTTSPTAHVEIKRDSPHDRTLVRLLGCGGGGDGLSFAIQGQYYFFMAYEFNFRESPPETCSFHLIMFLTPNEYLFGDIALSRFEWVFDRGEFYYLEAFGGERVD